MTSVVAPPPYPCPSCTAPITRSYAEIEPDDGIVDPRRARIPKVIWSDGAIRPLNPEDSFQNYRAPLCQLGDYIAVCPKCGAMFPALFLPWSIPEMSNLRQLSERSLEESVLQADLAPQVKDQFHNSISRATLEQTISYFEKIESKTAVTPTWATWTAAQQIVNLASEMVRDGEAVEPDLDERARACLRSFLDSISNMKAGTLRNLAETSEIGEKAIVPEDYFDTLFVREEYAVLSNMGRITGARDDFGWSIVSRYLPRRRSNEEPLETEWLGELLMENEQNDAWAVFRPIPNPNARPLGEFIDGMWVEREIDLGDVLDALDIDYNAGPSHLFAIHRETGLLEAIAMIGDKNPDEVIVAIKGAYARDKQALHYWHSVDRSEFETFISGDYELWLFDYGSEADEPGDEETAEETALQYELPIVQRWSKNDVLRREDVGPIARFIGYQYSMEELAHFLG